MFSIFKIFKKKKIVPHIRLSGIIGSVGKFKQGLDFSSQQEIINKYSEEDRNKLFILKHNLEDKIQDICKTFSLKNSKYNIEKTMDFFDFISEKTLCSKFISIGSYEIL